MTPPFEIIHPEIPQDIIECAVRLNNWMRMNEHNEWQLMGCADRSLVTRLQKELKDAEVWIEAKDSLISGYEKMVDAIQIKADAWDAVEEVFEMCGTHEAIVNEVDKQNRRIGLLIKEQKGQKK